MLWAPLMKLEITIFLWAALRRLRFVPVAGFKRPGTASCPWGVPVLQKTGRVLLLTGGAWGSESGRILVRPDMFCTRDNL